MTGVVAKPWWKSKTLASSVLIAVGGVIVPAALPGTIIDPEQGLAGAAVAVLFGVLRLLSKTKLVP